MKRVREGKTATTSGGRIARVAAAVVCMAIAWGASAANACGDLISRSLDEAQRDALCEEVAAGWHGAARNAKENAMPRAGWLENTGEETDGDVDETGRTEEEFLALVAGLTVQQAATDFRGITPKMFDHTGTKAVVIPQHRPVRVRQPKTWQAGYPGGLGWY